MSNETKPAYSWGAEAASFNDVMRLGTHREKTEAICEFGCASALVYGIVLGPFTYGVFESFAGTIENNPDRVQRATNIMIADGALLISAVAATGVAGKIRSFIRRLQINQTPTEITIRYHRQPKSDEPNSSN